MNEQQTIFDNGTWKHELRPVSELKPNKLNPRVITKKTIAGLRKSMQANGYTHRIVIDQHNKILSGHARWLVLKEDDPNAIIECLVAQRELTPKEEKDAILGHNVVGGEWDIAAVQMNFEPVDWEQFDLVFDLAPAEQIDETKDPEPNGCSIAFTDEEFVIVQDAMNLARDVLQIDPQSKPNPGAIVAMCYWFLDKVRPDND